MVTACKLLVGGLCVGPPVTCCHTYIGPHQFIFFTPRPRSPLPPPPSLTLAARQLPRTRPTPAIAVHTA
eukprot:353301-Chlamydomonas_euryale.AAC.4